MFDPVHLHPIIVHFPIALLIVGFLADLVGLVWKRDFLTKTAFLLLVVGTIGVIAAYVSGNLAGDGVSESGALKSALETHEAAATMTIWIMSVAAIVRIALVYFNRFAGSLKWVALALFLLGVASLARTGYYGGHLVYEHAAGVQLDLGLGAVDNANSSSETGDKD